MSEHLDLTRYHVGIYGALGARPHAALHLEHELAAHLFRGGESFHGVGVEDHLHQAFAIAQIDEDHPTVIPPAMHPAAQHDLLAEQVLGDLTAIMAAHGMCPLGKSEDVTVSPRCWQYDARR